MGLCDRNCVILRKNRSRYTLNKEMLDLFNEESVSGVQSWSYCECLKSDLTAKVPLHFLGCYIYNT